jgi:hypothetical protein
MCSFRRQLEKFHLSVQVPLKPAEKLAEKALSFSLTDAGTPLLGKLCKQILAQMPGYESTGLLSRWGDSHEVGDQYPNDEAAWMIDRVCEECPDLDVASFDEWLSTPRTITELLNCPCFYEEGREHELKSEQVEPGLLIMPPTVIRVDGGEKSNPLSGTGSSLNSVSVPPGFGDRATDAVFNGETLA